MSTVEVNVRRLSPEGDVKIRLVLEKKFDVRRHPAASNEVLVSSQQAMNATTIYAPVRLEIIDKLSQVIEVL